MLQRVIIKGFKSIKTMDIELRPLNILIGANGAGKSNLISFFKMLHEMMDERLQQYIGISGYAQSLLHFGPKVTRQIEAKLEFKTQNNDEILDIIYTICLKFAAGDTLIFAEETGTRNGSHLPQPSTTYSFGAGHQETKINKAAQAGTPTIANTIKKSLNYCRVYHFHDTSSTAAVRLAGYVDDNLQLKPDAGNLAALLLRFREDNNIVYQRIIKTIRLIAPFFDDFVLERRGTNIILNWREKGSDQVFGPHQFSDGTLRAICLTTLLLQPEEDLPELIIVDEPELGLHPYALNVVAAMFGKASYHTQILISTQSSSFLDNFNPEDVITVDREGKESQFKRLNPEELETWLEEYSLGEMWEKNIIGGGPH
ncbi:AAA family ATPase [Cronbergia sp. UHCC 0137]|uniref:AAA family ATPase n=1 Tax=Cronbergia sp. UHCC 0137 TaxID=3110239 RepID=UPI002B2210C7|nr:AAA family ATPase [Cronbergia sp. UHCC 0137]MEA5616938.1 AAA family ATPase [Cronbergia sp. UHCC 0137]